MQSCAVKKTFGKIFQIVLRHPPGIKVLHTKVFSADLAHAVGVTVELPVIHPTVSQRCVCHSTEYGIGSGINKSVCRYLDEFSRMVAI